MTKYDGISPTNKIFHQTQITIYYDGTNYNEEQFKKVLGHKISELGTFNRDKLMPNKNFSDLYLESTWRDIEPIKRDFGKIKLCTYNLGLEVPTTIVEKESEENRNLADISKRAGQLLIKILQKKELPVIPL